MPDDRVQYYFNAADVLVQPYRYTYTSGATFLALTFARPVIAPRMGNLPEVVHDERIGVLFEPRNVASLEAAMKTMRERSGQDMTPYLRQESDRYEWDSIWPIAAKAYREVMSTAR